jgi:hypothetical protein
VRLADVERGERLSIRVIIKLARLPDVIRTMLYRPRLFGGPYLRVLHPLMRGPSPWTVGERELFAAYTSRLNQCPF